MKILNASHVADTGGNGIRTAWAFSRLTDWPYRATARTSNYLDYPRDLPWEQARAAWLEADVVHVRDGFQAERLLGVPHRPTVIHQHGTQFRRYMDQLLREQRDRRAIGLAATLDLYLMAPDELVWMPALYDLDWLASLRRPLDDGVLRIAHAPTNRAIKSTEAFLLAVERLRGELPIELILIERTAWRDCIAAKATADIYFDQVALGYGNNAIEAWGMGQPVIAGGSDDTLREMKRRFDGLPFMEADEGTIYDALRAMAEPAVRARWARIGSDHAKRFHSEVVGVAALQAVYEAAYAGQRVAA